jgi:hypothetical protein
VSIDEHEARARAGVESISAEGAHPRFHTMRGDQAFSVPCTSMRFCGFTHVFQTQDCGVEHAIDADRLQFL